MDDQEWRQATTPMKLHWLRQELGEQNRYVNQVHARLQDLERRAVAQALEMAGEIERLAARLAALEAEAAQRKT